MDFASKELEKHDFTWSYDHENKEFVGICVCGNRKKRTVIGMMNELEIGQLSQKERASLKQAFTTFLNSIEQITPFIPEYDYKEKEEYYIDNGMNR